MGVVYLAEDLHLGRQVAIKFLTTDDTNYRARFLREARTVSALSHPNIAAVFDYGEFDGRPYIVMELVRGKTLNKLLHEDGLTLNQAVEIAASIVEALTEAHSNGIVHRDIKPSNVVVTQKGVKVLDFGLVKQLFDTRVCDIFMGRLQKRETTSIICMLVHHADNGGLLWRKGSVSWRCGGATFSGSWKRWEIFGRG